jgi:prophage regulatory protein
MPRPKLPINPVVNNQISVFSLFDQLPDSGFVREAQLVLSPKRPEHPAPLPFSAPTLWRKVAAGTFPKPIKLSERVTCWRVSEVRAWMTAQATV